MKNGKIVLGVLSGLAIGTILGILFAPNSGARTRKKLLHKSEDYADVLKEKAAEYLESLKGKYELIKKETDAIIKP